MPGVLLAILCLGVTSTTALAADESIEAAEQKIIDSLIPPKWQKPLGEGEPRLVIMLPDKTERIVLSADGKLVISSRNQDTVRVNRVLAHFSLEILLALCGLALLITCFMRVRVHRRARVPGEPYCRKCNYRLTGSTSATCPECGVGLARKRPAIGPPHWRSRVVTAIACATPLILAGLALTHGPAIRAAYLFQKLPQVDWAWPRAWIKQWPNECLSNRTMLDVHDAAAGHWVTSIAMPPGARFHDLLPAGDGIHVHVNYWYENAAAALGVYHIARVNCLTGETTTCVHPDDYVMRAIADDNRTYVMMQRTAYEVFDAVTGVRTPVNIEATKGTSILFDPRSNRFAEFKEEGSLRVFDGVTGKQVAGVAMPKWFDDKSVWAMLDGEELLLWDMAGFVDDPGVFLGIVDVNTKNIDRFDVSSATQSVHAGLTRTLLRAVALPVTRGRYAVLVVEHADGGLNAQESLSHAAICIWDRRERKVIHRLDGPLSFFYACEPFISRDGRTLMLPGRETLDGVRQQAWLYDISRFAETMEKRE